MVLGTEDLSGSRGMAGVMQDVCDTVWKVIPWFPLNNSPRALYGRQGQGYFVGLDGPWYLFHVLTILGT